ncbi:hypothetical protein PPERSA_06197 [Pseudocohnilembus persalinus]|uniref:Uncharacterized protein n=1 Tax=Pseudocohnilembus persalinus TaxID=266149 RepID=A0A0V0R0J7_PSEPJ|nr:hypothetical protein PPERSA_06197 [Pseudocohnilembus persalinus]|eukprot:KRX08019.1 hypothetical protein PPERSA_06197 [Pseudocohnilembus persalinus]
MNKEENNKSIIQNDSKNNNESPNKNNEFERRSKIIQLKLKNNELERLSVQSPDQNKNNKVTENKSKQKKQKSELKITFRDQYQDSEQETYKNQKLKYKNYDLSIQELNPMRYSEKVKIFGLNKNGYQQFGQQNKQKQDNQTYDNVIGNKNIKQTKINIAQNKYQNLKTELNILRNLVKSRNDSAVVKNRKPSQQKLQKIEMQNSKSEKLMQNSLSQDYASIVDFIINNYDDLNIAFNYIDKQILGDFQIIYNQNSQYCISQENVQNEKQFQNSQLQQTYEKQQQNKNLEEKCGQHESDQKNENQIQNIELIEEQSQKLKDQNQFGKQKLQINDQINKEKSQIQNQIEYEKKGEIQQKLDQNCEQEKQKEKKTNQEI